MMKQSSCHFLLDENWFPNFSSHCSTSTSVLLNVISTTLVHTATFASIKIPTSASDAAQFTLHIHPAAQHSSPQAVSYTVQPQIKMKWAKEEGEGEEGGKRNPICAIDSEVPTFIILAGWWDAQNKINRFAIDATVGLYDITSTDNICTIWILVRRRHQHAQAHHHQVANTFCVRMSDRTWQNSFCPLSVQWSILRTVHNTAHTIFSRRRVRL